MFSTGFLSVRVYAAENRDFVSYPLHSTPLSGCPRRNIAIPFGVERLE